MLEIIVKGQEDRKEVFLVENGKLIEYYEENIKNNRNEGNIYIGIVKDIVEGMGSAFVDIGTEKNSFIHLKDVLPKVDELKEVQPINHKIKEVLKPNQKLLVQVKKDSNDKKGARISTHINLPSKYICLMPNTDIVTVSQKIEDKKEQERLKKLVRENLQEGNGAVVRTSAEGKTEEIIEDIKNIEDKWNSIIETSINPNKNKPQLLYKSEDLVEKMLMDLNGENIEKIRVNDRNEYMKLEKLKKQNREYAKIEISEEDLKEVFDKYSLEKQVKKLEDRKIWLKCGGFITIDKTEALTAVDVNTGKYTGGRETEDTIYRVNKEATVEIAKQIRLRDIGGIIIIDYIDMNKENSKEKIEELLKEELKKDRAKTQVEGFTNLDLMELTRKHICSHKN